MKRNSFVNQSTLVGERSAGESQLSEFYRQEMTEAKNKLYAKES